MSDILEQICAKKMALIIEQRVKFPESFLEQEIKNNEAPRKFVQALKTSLKLAPFSLIAEIKKASPSRGLIRKSFNPAELAVGYKNGGATCISVLTDTPFFQGDKSHLIEVRSAVELPILRKDFMVDPYQILEARAIGADCVLLIMAALTDKHAALLNHNAKELNLDVLIEVHDENELDIALQAGAEIIGINNRDLTSFITNMDTTYRLAKLIPNNKIIISESGIKTKDDINKLKEVGVDAVLVGESLITSNNTAKKLRELVCQK